MHIEDAQNRHGSAANNKETFSRDMHDYVISQLYGIGDDALNGIGSCYWARHCTPDSNISTWYIIMPTSRPGLIVALSVWTPCEGQEWPWMNYT